MNSKQVDLVRHVASGTSLKTARDTVGVSAAEVKKWMQDPEFYLELTMAQARPQAVAEMTLLKKSPDKWLKGPGRRRQPHGGRPQASTPKETQCTAKAKTSGERCRRKPVPGLDKCKLHCGMSPDKAREKGSRNLALLKIKREMDTERPTDVNPIEALMACISEAAYWVASMRYMTDQLGEVYGENHLGDGAPHVLMEMLGKWTDRLAHYSKLAVDAGLEARMIRVAEQQVEVFVRAVEAGMTAAGISPAQRDKARKKIGAELRALPGGAA